MHPCGWLGSWGSLPDTKLPANRQVTKENLSTANLGLQFFNSRDFCNGDSCPDCGVEITAPGDTTTPEGPVGTPPPGENCPCPCMPCKQSNWLRSIFCQYFFIELGIWWMWGSCQPCVSNCACNQHQQQVQIPQFPQYPQPYDFMQQGNWQQQPQSDWKNYLPSNWKRPSEWFKAVERKA